jgi:uncharacterized protein with NRDE domain
MCTVTWLHEPGGYHVLFNRDEKVARAAARPPERRLCGRVRFLAPIDGRAGGSWLAVNERGLALGLLNHYPAESEAKTGKISRGLLVTSLMDAGDATAVERALRGLDLAEYSPFLMIAVDARPGPACFTWDGTDFAARQLTDADRPLTTSSYRSKAVVAARRATFERMVAEEGAVSVPLLTRYHASRNPKGDAFSVFMKRTDAETVSFSRVYVTSAGIRFFYAPRPRRAAEFPDASVYTLTRS